MVWFGWIVKSMSLFWWSLLFLCEVGVCCYVELYEFLFLSVLLGNWNKVIFGFVKKMFLCEKLKNWIEFL